MNSDEREAVLRIFKQLGVTVVRRALPVDQTEEVFLVPESEFQRLSEPQAVKMLMAALPHRKVGVAADRPPWKSQAL